MRASPGGFARVIGTVMLVITLNASAVPSSAQPRLDREDGTDVFSLPRMDFLSRLFVDIRGDERTPGWYLVPSVTFSEEFDSNIFGSSTRKQSDFVTRLSVGASASYLSDRARLIAMYSVGSEWLADHSELNDTVARQLTGIDLEYAATRRATLGLIASFSLEKGITQAVQETGAAGVEVGRSEVSVVRASPFVSYRFGAATSVEASYDFARSDVSGGSVNTKHEGELTAAYQLTALDRATLSYIADSLQSDKGHSLASHTILPGFIRLLTPHTTATLAVGPRFSGGEVNVDVRAGLVHRFASGTASFSYVRADDIVIGLTGAQTRDTVGAFVELSPLRVLRVGLGSSVSRIVAAGKDASDSVTMTYAVNALASYSVTPWLVARLGYRFSLQDNAQNIARHLVTLSVEFRYPVRVLGQLIGE